MNLMGSMQVENTGGKSYVFLFVLKKYDTFSVFKKF